MSRYEDREAEGFYIIRVIDVETGKPVETTWAKTRAHASIRLDALRERYDTPDVYRFETEET